MKQLKTVLLAATLVAASSIAASAQSAPSGNAGGTGTASGAAEQRSGTAGSGMANPSPASRDVRGASQTKSDPAAVGTSGRDKQTGAPKDKD
jgi:long-subunit fatty acid transport protein